MRASRGFARRSSSQREEQQDRHEEEAAVQVRPRERDEREQPQARRMALAPCEEPEREREQREPEQLRTRRQGVEGNEQRADREPGRDPNTRASCPAREEHQPEREAREHRADDRDQLPAAGAVQEREHDLGAPLLVQPRLPAHGEGEQVGLKDVVGVEHHVPGADQVREVDRGHREAQRDDDRQEHGDHGQELGERQVPPLVPVHAAPLVGGPRRDVYQRRGGRARTRPVRRRARRDPRPGGRQRPRLARARPAEPRRGSRRARGVSCRATRPRFRPGCR